MMDLKEIGCRSGEPERTDTGMGAGSQESAYPSGIFEKN
jgi:hypothetical protein